MPKPSSMGVKTFLFTDIEGSTRRWEGDRASMREALARHDSLMRSAIEAHRGSVFKTVGDEFCAAFDSVSDAAAAACAAQRSVGAADFSAVDGMHVRMALHSGIADERDGDYFGPVVNRVARLLAAGTGGQVLVSGTTRKLLESAPASGIALRDLGEHRLKDLEEPEHIFQMEAEGLQSDFPPLRSLDAEEIRPTPSFTGRENELRALAEAFSNSEGTVVIHGLGGTGKSSLAREYAWRNRERYAVAWWLNAETLNGIIDGLLQLGSLFMKGLDTLADRRAAAQQVVRTTLSSFTKPLLLIFDNLEDERLLRAWSPPARSHVLATSRNAAWGSDITTLPLRTWSLDDSIGYLRRECRRTDLDDVDARALAEGLGSLPLALAHAAAYLRATRTVTPRRYIERIARQMESAPPNAEYPRSVSATFQEAVAAAERQAPGAAAILCLAAWFSPDAIPDEVFRRPVELFPDGLKPVLPGEMPAHELRWALGDGMRVDDALGSLDRLSLLSFSESMQSYSMHRLVQLAGRDLVGAAKRAWVESAVATADALFPAVEFANWPNCERFLPHARAALDALPSDTDFVVAGGLADRCGDYHRQRAAYGDAEPLLARALAIREKLLGPDHPEVAASLNDSAVLYRKQGRYAEAEPLHARALAIFEKALGPDDENVAHSLTSLALLYREQGRYAEAEPLHLRALAIFEKTLGPEHEKVANSLTNFALLYSDQGRYAEAESLHVRALAIREKVLGPDHPDTAVSVNNLAVSYADSLRLDEAAPLFARALAIREKALGPDHPDVAQSLNNLAVVYDDQLRHADAEPLHLRALEIREKVLGPGHRDVALSLNNLAIVYVAQRRHSEAEALHVRALGIFEKALGPNHPDVAMSLNNLANAYNDPQRNADAERLHLRALEIRERVLGPDHLDTAASLNSLAALYLNQGRYAEAQPLRARALAIHESLLGADHPSTQATRRSLAELAAWCPT